MIVVVIVKIVIVVVIVTAVMAMKTLENVKMRPLWKIGRAHFWHCVYMCVFTKRNIHCIKGSTKKKITGLFGNFDHFLPYFFGQVGNFWVIL